MKDNFTLVVMVLDKSGSMSSVQADTIGGFNNFIQKQKELPGECKFSLVQFDYTWHYTINNLDIVNVPELSEATFTPYGGTALLDTLGNTINQVGSDLRQMKEGDRPSKVLFIVLTDGQENSSYHFSRDQVFDMIKRQREIYSWEFIFLGANQNAISSGLGMGFTVGKSATFVANTKGTQSTYTAINKLTTQYRSSISDQGMVDFDNDDKDSMMGK